MPATALEIEISIEKVIFTFLQHDFFLFTKRLYYHYTWTRMHVCTCCAWLRCVGMWISL